MPLDRSIPGALELRRIQLVTSEESSGGTFENSFLVDTEGQGEAIAQVDFNVRFTQRPFLSTGWSMKPNQRLAAGFHPVIDAGVYVWKSGRKADTGLPFFDGATISINVFNGAPGLLAEVHLTFRAPAIRDPAGR